MTWIQKLMIRNNRLLQPQHSSFLEKLIIYITDLIIMRCNLGLSQIFPGIKPVVVYTDSKT